MYHLPFVIFHLREIVASRRLAVVLDRQREKAKMKNDKCQMLYDQCLFWFSSASSHPS
jgi:hypothetical protein